MKKIGIVGGIGWRSTVEYYAGICQRSEELGQKANPGASAVIAEIAIESLDLSKAVAYLGTEGDEQSWHRFDEYHREALHRLAAIGAEVGLIASNTPHHRFAQITRDVEIPVINLFEAAADTCVRMGAKTVLIFGTERTMGSAVFRAVFAEHRILASGPSDPRTQAAVTEVISNLQMGRFDGCAQRIAELARLSSARQLGGNAAVCLACTELPLAFQDFRLLPTFEYENLSFANTTAIHVEAAIASAFGDGKEEQPQRRGFAL